MKPKIILIALCAVVVLAAGYFLWQKKSQQDYQQKIFLAKRINNVIGNLMFELRQTKPSNIQGVPADGQWHKRPMADPLLSVRMRRQSVEPSLVEVQIKAQQNLSLTSNFKVRMQD